jgi:hypothetical protein
MDKVLLEKEHPIKMVAYHVMHLHMNIKSTPCIFCKNMSVNMNMNICSRRRVHG